MAYILYEFYNEVKINPEENSTILIFSCIYITSPKNNIDYIFVYNSCNYIETY